jgi:hypothetical protein
MAKLKSKERVGAFEKIIMSMPAPERNLIIDKIFRFAVLDKRPVAEKLYAEKLRIEKLGAKNLRTKRLVIRKRRAAVRA